MAPQPEDYARARNAFEYFTSPKDADIAFMENAGGSQVPRCVVEAMSEFFSWHYAQLGAGHPRSQRATQIVKDAHSWLEVLMNTAGQGQVVMGPSTSQLAFNLAFAFTAVLGPGDNLVLQEASHESVVGPWVRLAALTGCSVRWWRADRRTGSSPLEGLEAALDGATRLVAVTHVSNLLGETLDLPAVVQLVRSRAPSAQVLADGVAYAPHRAMDVAAWGVDWYLWSAYKVYGPHVAVMYGRRQAFESLLARGGQGPNHYFVPAADLTYTFELGGASHEACAGLLALQDYLLTLLGPANTAPTPATCQDATPQLPSSDTKDPTPPAPTRQQTDPSGPSSSPSDPASSTDGPPGTSRPVHPLGLLRGVHVTRAQVEAAFDLITHMERPLQERLLPYLAAHPAVRLVGSADPDPATRVPTVSFVHRRQSSERVSRALQAAGFAVRHGHMYARRLVEALVEEGALLGEGAAARQAAAAAGGDKGGVHGDGESEGGSGEGGTEIRPPFDVDRAVDDGVVRISLVHYNTLDEVERLIEALGRCCEL